MGLLHSECYNVVPFFYRLFFRVPPLLSSIEWSAPPPSLKSLATPLIIPNPFQTLPSVTMEIRSTEDSWSSRLVIICHICWVPIYFSHTYTSIYIYIYIYNISLVLHVRHLQFIDSIRPKIVNIYLYKINSISLITILKLITSYPA